MNDFILQAVNVSRSFILGNGLLKKNKILQAVSHISLNLRRGEVLGLVGESGCGKSTLAKMLVGLLPSTEGEILIDHIPIKDINRLELARRVQPVFQDPYSSLNPRKKIGETIGLPLLIHSIGTSAERRRQTIDMMERVGLPARFFDSYPMQLSGGQRQRVAIARALIVRPDLLICDEPTSALDVSVQAQILNLLLDLQSEFKLTYVLISHNLAVVQHMAQRVAVMYLGRIVEEGAVESVFKSPKHPYTQALLRSVLTPEPGLGMPELGLGLAYPNALNPPTGCAFHPRCSQAISVCSQSRPTDTLVEGSRVACHLY
ncbi:AppF ABC-type oligopeptide transport system, ATPase component [Burkholderiaceae bacterium]